MPKLFVFLFSVLFSLRESRNRTSYESEYKWSPSTEDHNIKIGMAVLILIIVGVIIVVVTLCLRVTPEDAYKLLRIIIDWLLNQDWLFDYNALSLATQKLYHILS